MGRDRAHRFSDKLQRFTSLKTKAEETVFTPRQLETNGIAVRQDGRRRSAFDLLGQADLDVAVRYADVMQLIEYIEAEVLRRARVKLEREVRFLQV